jgi:hypothetical protein
MDGEAVIYFPAKLFPKIAKLAGARRKRKLTPEQKERLAKAGTAYRFKSQDNGVGL